MATADPGTGPPSQDAEAAFASEVERNLRRNYSAQLAHGLLGQTGMRLINAPTFVPAYVFALSGSELAVGIARGLQYLGMFLSPIVGATIIEHRRRVLPVAFFAGALMRLQILGLGLAGLWLAPPWPLLACFLFLLLFGVFLGVQGVVFNFLVAKVIPVSVRGRLMGLRNALSGLTAAAVGWYAGGTLVESDVFGNGYATTFLLAFALTSVGLLMLLFLREPESPRVREASPVAQRLRDLPELLRSDPHFTRYFLARALAVMGRMAVPFYFLYANERMALSGSELGLLTAGFVLAQSPGQPGLGHRGRPRRVPGRVPGRAPHLDALRCGAPRHGELRVAADRVRGLGRRPGWLPALGPEPRARVRFAPRPAAAHRGRQLGFGAGSRRSARCWAARSACSCRTRRCSRWRSGHKRSPWASC